MKKIIDVALLLLLIEISTIPGGREGMDGDPSSCQGKKESTVSRRMSGPF